MLQQYSNTEVTPSGGLTPKAEIMHRSLRAVQPEGTACMADGFCIVKICFGKSLHACANWHLQHGCRTGVIIETAVKVPGGIRWGYAYCQDNANNIENSAASRNSVQTTMADGFCTMNICLCKACMHTQCIPENIFTWTATIVDTALKCKEGSGELTRTAETVQRALRIGQPAGTACRPPWPRVSAQ